MARLVFGGEVRKPTGRRIARNLDLAALVDDWLASLERGLCDPEDLEAWPEPATPPRADVAASDLRALEQPSRHVRSLPDPSARADAAAGGSEWDSNAESVDTAYDVTAAVAGVRVSGDVVSFSDAFGGRVALLRTGSGFRHLGSVAVRGPQSPPANAFQDLGASPAASRAFEYVASWYGSPFDAANVRLRPGVPLNWGFWNFSGRDLCSALAECKRRSPDSFNTLLRRYGIDVVASSRRFPDPQRGNDGTDASTEPGSRETAGVETASRWELAVHGDRDQSVCGRGAARLISSDARRLAALARAGRDPDIQLAQIHAALTAAVAPSLALPWRTAAGILPAGEALRTPHELAALLFLVMRLGVGPVKRTLEAVGASDGRGSGIGTTEQLAAALWHLGEEALAHQMMRILASPELDA